VTPSLEGTHGMAGLGSAAGLGGAAGLDGSELRDLVRQTLREVLPGLLAGGAAGPEPGARAGAGAAEAVTITTDAELSAFVARVLRLADDPATGADLRAGRLAFRLRRLDHYPAAAATPTAGASPAAGTSHGAAPGPVHRVERGAVLERHVKAAAAAGSALVVGPRAVLTPLARERARASGVELVVEPRDTSLRRDA